VGAEPALEDLERLARKITYLGKAPTIGSLPMESVMRILVAGNMGYVGPAVVRELRARHPDFAHCLTGSLRLPEGVLDRQHFGDIRELRPGFLEGFDAVIALAAVSNDPMGDRFSAVTAEINEEANVAMARAAAAAGVHNFVFASSCSVYGAADGGPRTESDPVNPITAYAKSKIGTERRLAQIRTEMVITCLRFATACGMSDRLRLDLVLNDFVACAMALGRITVLSDGTPWRPLIDTQDMARGIDWAAHREASNGGRFLVVNTGANDHNYQVRDLARAVAAAVPGTEISINTQAPADSRSYMVDFGLFASLATDYLPIVGLEQSISELIDGLTRMSFADEDFRNSQLIRLKVLERHIAANALTPSLKWIS
jgi:nucleoside-diphosphate-sugar epimerase